MDNQDPVVLEDPPPELQLMAKVHNTIHTLSNASLQQSDMYGSLLQSAHEMIARLQQEVREKDEQIKALESRVQLAMGARKEDA